MSLTVFAPASMGNVSVGFDLLGAALAPIDGSLLGDKVSIKADEKGLSLSVGGPWAHKLPEQQHDNIVYQCAEFFLQQQHIHSKGIAIYLEKNLPVGRGLGASASSVVAALSALNEYFSQPYTQHELLMLMGEFEGKISGSIHYDNVAPSYLGGMQLMLHSTERVCDAIPAFDSWYWVVAYSGISLSTAKMRQLLPDQYDKSTTIDFGRHLAAFVHASYSQDKQLAISALKDVLAEPYRADSIPGFREASEALKQLGMSVSGISGSGPTLFSVTDDLGIAQQAQALLEQQYLMGTAGFVHICKLDKQGARRVD